MPGQAPDQRPAPSSWRPTSAIPRAPDRHRTTMAQGRADRQAKKLLAWATRHDDPGQRMVEVAALMQAIGGDHGLLAELGDARRAAIEARHAQGVPWVQIARELGVSVTRLQQIRRGD